MPQGLNPPRASQYLCYNVFSLVFSIWVSVTLFNIKEHRRENLYTVLDITSQTVCATLFLFNKLT